MEPPLIGSTTVETISRSLGDDRKSKTAAGSSFYIYLDGPKETCEPTTRNHVSSLQQAFENYRKSKLVIFSTKKFPQIKFINFSVFFFLST